VSSPINLDAIRAVEVQHDPFDFFVVPDAVAQPNIDRIVEAYPKIDKPGNYDASEFDYGDAFAELMAQIRSPELAEVVGERFGVQLDPAEMTITVRTLCEASDGNIHPDHWSKIVTVLFYFNPPWDTEGGRLRMLRSNFPRPQAACRSPQDGAGELESTGQSRPRGAECQSAGDPCGETGGAGFFGVAIDRPRRVAGWFRRPLQRLPAP
jgi:hypothetical protein